MHTYHEVKDMLKQELDDIVKKGELSAGSLETIDKLLNSIKNACKITMYEEYAEDGYSQAGEGGMSYGGSSYAYARGRGSNASRDSRGRYSSEGGGSSYARGGRGGGRSSRRGGYSYDDGEQEEKIEMLREMMQEVNTDEERRALQKIIRRMEQDS